MKEFKKDFIGFGLFLLFLFIAWIISGGPQHAKETGNDSRVLQKPPAPLDTGETYNPY